MSDADPTTKLHEEIAAFRREAAETTARLAAEVAALRELVVDREEWLIGWKAIAEFVGYSEDHAKELGQDPHDPIPHVRRGGFVEAPKSLLKAWLFRRRVPAQRKAAKAPGQVGVADGPRRQLGLFDGAPATPRRGRARDGSAS